MPPTVQTAFAKKLRWMQAALAIFLGAPFLDYRSSRNPLLPPQSHPAALDAARGRTLPPTPVGRSASPSQTCGVAVRAKPMLEMLNSEMFIVVGSWTVRSGICGAQTFNRASTRKTVDT